MTRMNCSRCGGQCSMSSQSMGEIWWRCIMCGLIQAGRRADPPPPIPAVMPASRGLASACQAQPAHQGQTAGGVVVQNQQAQGAEAHPIDGCCVCGADEVSLVLESAMGVDAATLAQGHTVRAGFCSQECLAKKLGLVVPNGGLQQPA